MCIRDSNIGVLYYHQNRIKEIEGFTFKNARNVYLDKDKIYILSFWAGIWKGVLNHNEELEQGTPEERTG